MNEEYVSIGKRLGKIELTSALLLLIATYSNKHELSVPIDELLKILNK